MAHRGDVFPYVPIANELATRGHDVIYVVPREFHALFAGEAFALCFIPVGFTMDALESGEEPEGAPHFTEGMVHEFEVTS